MDAVVSPATKKDGSIFSSLKHEDNDGDIDLTVKVDSSSLKSIIPKGATDIHAFAQYDDGTELLFGLGTGDSVLFF